MSFAVIVPNTNESPGAFPTQANNNFQRIFDVVNAEHIFNTTAQSTDGCHKVVSLLSQGSDPAIPIGMNGIFFAKVFTVADGGNNQIELYWRNVNRVQRVTALEFSTPVRLVGTSSFNPGETKTIFADPGYNYTGMSWGFVTANVCYRMYNTFKATANGSVVELASANTTGITRPSISYSGTNLQMTNNDASVRSLTYSLIINRV